MPEVITLIFQGVEGLVFNPPAGAAATLEFHDFARGAQDQCPR
jgi:hypothetical protein